MYGTAWVYVCVCVIFPQVLRRLIEQENPGCASPAAEWEEDEWSDCQEAVVSMQNKLAALGVVRLICSVLGSVRPRDFRCGAVCMRA